MEVVISCKSIKKSNWRLIKTPDLVSYLACGPVVLHALHCVFQFTGGGGRHDQILTGPLKLELHCRRLSNCSRDLPDRPASPPIVHNVSKSSPSWIVLGLAHSIKNNWDPQSSSWISSLNVSLPKNVSPALSDFITSSTAPIPSHDYETVNNQINPVLFSFFLPNQFFIFLYFLSLLFPWDLLNYLERLHPHYPHRLFLFFFSPFCALTFSLLFSRWPYSLPFAFLFEKRLHGWRAAVDGTD